MPAPEVAQPPSRLQPRSGDRPQAGPRRCVKTLEVANPDNFEGIEEQAAADAAALGIDLYDDDGGAA